MLFVVIVHSSQYLGPVYGIETRPFISEFALICDPIFFVLSGYFAFRTLKKTNAKYLLNFSEIPIKDVCFNWFYSILFGGWWFVPALIPFLVLAPFLFTMFEALSDFQCKLLMKVVALFTLWGALCTVLQWISTLTGIGSLNTLPGLLSGFVPTNPIPGGYFMYFCLGYFIRRMPSLYSVEFLKRIATLGIVGWLFGAVAALAGYVRSDPSYLWLFASIGIFLVFDKIQITDECASKIINWTAKRSYSIYLLQYTTIAIVYGIFNQFGILDGTANMAFWIRVPLQAIAVSLSWLFALGGASIVDSLILEPIQNFCKMKLKR